MKKLLIFLAVSFSPLFAFPAYPLETVATETETHSVTTEATITIPKDWKFASYPMPLEGASNFRITFHELRFAITGLPFVANSNPMFSKYVIKPESYVAQALADPMLQYVRDADKSFHSTPFTGSGYVGAYVTYRSSTGKPVFNVFPGKLYACVTTAAIKTEKTIFSISIASDECDGNEHTAAISALKSFAIING